MFEVYAFNAWRKSEVHGCDEELNYLAFKLSRLHYMFVQKMWHVGGIELRIITKRA